MLKIEKPGYRYPSLVFSLNGQTWMIRIKQGRGKKWIGIKNIESVHFIPTIENDILRNNLRIPVRDIEKLVRKVLSDFPTRMNNTNEPARTWIWDYRKGVYDNKSGMLGS